MAEHSIILMIFICSILTHIASSKSSSKGDEITVNLLKALKGSPMYLTSQQVHCVKGEPSFFNPVYTWGTVEVKLNFNTEGSRLYLAESREALEEAQNPSKAKRFLSLVADTDTISGNVFYLSPFKYSCFNVQRPEQQNDSYNVQLTLKKFHWTFPLSLVFGLLLFMNADKLSRSVTFYYSSGIVLGIGASLLLVIFLLHRLVPSRAGAYTLLAGGWSLSLYFIQWSWNNLVDLVLERNPFVVGYFFFAGLISFGLCYYNGPVTNERGINLIRWTIQLISTYFIYKGVQPESLSLAVIIIVYTYSFLSSDLIRRLLDLLPQNLISYRVQYYLFPPKTQFLTEEEYEIQGVTETQKALMELRSYCNSPDCNAWKVISRVKDPKRLSSFITEGAHITDDEYNHFEENPFEYPTSEDFNGDYDED